MAITPLQRYRILVADADFQLSKVLKDVLESMGFADVVLTKSGIEALTILKEKPFDFIITDWQLEHLNGLEMITRIRREQVLPDPSLPIIMLTGRAEQTDVITARNAGMNEYVLKPFSAKSIYSRLERLIESPRNFIISPGFVGPDRRMKGVPPVGVAERRDPRLIVEPRPEKSSGKIIIKSGVHIWAPDTSLKQKLGKGITLASLITPAALESAQVTISSIAGESLVWIKENLDELIKLQQLMLEDNAYTLLPVNMSDTALSISSRAGTFGFSGASKVAYLLHKFCFSALRTENEQHQMITQQHINALKVMLSDGVKRTELGSEIDVIVLELQKLIDKYGN